jgi:type IV pilus assembly protein PilC
MQRHRCFPKIAVQLVRVGEATGNLDVVLERAANQMRTRRENISNVRTAVAYPAFVAVAAILVAGYLVLFVIPELEKFLSSIGRKLPAITQSLLDLSASIRSNGITVAVLILFTIAAFVLTYRWPPGRDFVDRWVLRIPILGTVLRLSGTVTFASAFGVMIRSGVTMLEALRTVEALQGNKYLAVRVAAVREAVIEGGSLSEPLSTKHAFMPMLSRMVAVAESTGELDEVLDQVTRFHETQLQASIKRLGRLIEPLTVVVVGGIVGYVYVAFFMALFAAGG